VSACKTPGEGQTLSEGPITLVRVRPPCFNSSLLITTNLSPPTDQTLTSNCIGTSLASARCGATFTR
jgi:hypothetical protein